MVEAGGRWLMWNGRIKIPRINNKPWKQNTFPVPLVRWFQIWQWSVQPNCQTLNKTSESCVCLRMRGLSARQGRQPSLDKERLSWWSPLSGDGVGHIHTFLLPGERLWERHGLHFPKHLTLHFAPLNARSQIAKQKNMSIIFSDLQIGINLIFCEATIIKQPARKKSRIKPQTKPKNENDDSILNFNTKHQRKINIFQTIEYVLKSVPRKKCPSSYWINGPPEKKTLGSCSEKIDTGVHSRT